MAKFPALPLWTDAYLADTVHLTVTESGAYLHLLMTAWRAPDCMLPNDEKFLARASKCRTNQWNTVREAVLAFWEVDSETGKLYQKRLRNERNFVQVKSQKAKQSARAKYLKNNNTASANAPPKQSERTASRARTTPTPLEEYTSNTELDSDTESLASKIRGASRNALSEFPPLEKLPRGGSNGKGNYAYPGKFNLLYDTMPKRPTQTKSDAYKAYRGAIRKHVAPITIQHGAEKHATYLNGDTEFAPLIESWLNGQGWTASYEQPAKATAPNGAGRGREAPRSALEIAAEIAADRARDETGR